jgi:small-conductance mechanosensitive channel
MGANAIRSAALKMAFCLVLGLPALSAAAEEAAPPAAAMPFEETDIEVNTAPVVVDGATLFDVRGIRAYPAEKRAREIAARIVTLAADRAISRDSLRIEETPNMTLVIADKTLVMGVLDADARLEGIDRQTSAKAYQIRIGEAIESWRRDREPGVLKRNGLYALVTTLLLVMALWVGYRLFHRLRIIIETRFKPKVHDIRVKKFRLLRGEQLWGMLTGVLRLVWVGTLLVVVYIYLYGVLSLFPWTRGFADRLSTILVHPLITLGRGLVEAIPNLVFLLVLFFLIRYILKLIRLFFASVADGTVVFFGFDAEWAFPTFRLVRMLLIAFAVIVAYPHIPGSDSGAFKGVSIFLGVLFSLGSSSLIGNLIAGYTMIYRRAFKAGDRVRIGEHVGDVERVRLLVTHLRTPKNEEVVIPNSTILNGEVVNYSTMARKQGLILHTTVGIGYEMPWRQVEAMLVEAAARTPGLLREPPPFVLQKALGDFCVTYEINVYCAEPQAMNRLYTALHRNILDVFNEYGVQIMTPAYEGDPARPKVVPKEQWYALPARPPEGKPEG